MINIVIPAAGNGQRFKDAGYEQPKPLIDILGKPMIERVKDNIRPSTAHSFILITRAEHGIKSEVILKRQTEGAVSTIITAQDFIDDSPLLLANCDQLVDFDVDKFIDSAQDGALVTFKSNNPHHSYVVTDGTTITKIVEKEVISNQAVTGIYYFKNGRDFLEEAYEVVKHDLKTKGEFYVSSVITRMIENGYKFTAYEAPTAILGTPNELQLFINAVRVGKTL